jgi:hypothetical protein
MLSVLENIEDQGTGIRHQVTVMLPVLYVCENDILC